MILIYNFIYMRLPKDKMLSISFGFLISFVGLVIFLAGINAFMQPFGNRVGVSLGLVENDWLIVLICFIIGLVTILCEPAVHVLTDQINQVSEGRISKSTVLIALSLGVGIAIALSTIRAIFNFSIIYYIIPLYGISLVLMFVCPDIYTAMAFDSGGTASGPMSTSFVLPMIIGIVSSISAINGEDPDYYSTGFGVVAMIAITPIIAIQILGLIENIKDYNLRKLMRGGEVTLNDAQIIHFE